MTFSLNDVLMIIGGVAGLAVQILLIYRFIVARTDSMIANAEARNVRLHLRVDNAFDRIETNHLAMVKLTSGLTGEVHTLNNNIASLLGAAKHGAVDAD